MDKPGRIHTLVFDLDDTLFAEREFVLGGFHAAGDWAEKTLGIAGLTETAARLFEAGHRDRIFDQALAQMKIKASPELVAELVAAYRGHRPMLHLLPDAQNVLQWAQPRFGLALISDGFLDVQRRKVAALGLEAIFPTIILTDAWGRDHWKPNRRSFDEVMRLVPNLAGGFMYVGDNPHKDFIGARTAGWQTVRVRRPGGEHSDYKPTPQEAADCEVVSLLELKSLVERL